MMTTTTTMPRATVKIGDRVQLLATVERFPHFLLEPGGEGTVTENDDNEVCVRMDDHIDGCEGWDNEVIWIPEDEGEFDNLPLRLVSREV